MWCDQMWCDHCRVFNIIDICPRLGVLGLFKIQLMIYIHKVLYFSIIWKIFQEYFFSNISETTVMFNFVQYHE